jgi:H+/Cl- antiporter ClcA
VAQVAVAMKILELFKDLIAAGVAAGVAQAFGEG